MVIVVSWGLVGTAHLEVKVRCDLLPIYIFHTDVVVGPLASM